MGLTVVVGGTDVSSVVEVSTLSITQVLSRRGDTATVTIVDESRARTFTPLQTITITDELGNVKFGGIVTHLKQATPGPTVTRWRLDCQDYSYYLQKTLTNKKYQAMTVDAIVKDLLVSFPPGVTITTNNVQANLPLLQYFNAPHLRLTDVFDKLVRMSSASAFLMWDLDANRDLHFFDQNHVPAAGVTLTDQPPTTSSNLYGVSVYGQVQYGAAGLTANYQRETFSYERDVSQFANQITFRGGTMISNYYTQHWVGNGTQTGFVFDYPPQTSTAASGYMPKVTLGGVVIVVGLDQSGGFGANAALVSVAQDSQSATLRFATAPTNGTAIQAVYSYDIPVLQRVKDGTSITSYGTWEEYVVDTNVKSVQAAAQRAGALLSQFAKPLATAAVDVARTYQGSLGAGQQVTLINTQLGLNTSMLITDCRISGQPGGGYAHSLKLAAYG